MKVQIEEINGGYQHKYNFGVNNVAIIVEECDDHYIFRQLYNNFSRHTGEGGKRQKIAKVMDKEKVEDAKGMALQVLQDILISEILPKNVGIEFEVITD